MIRRPSLVAIARLLNLAFFLGTTGYCLLAHNPFTNEQFIKPHVSAAIYGFSVWHPYVHWFVLSVTALTIAPYLERSAARWIGWAYLAAAVLFGAWLNAHRLWLIPGPSSTAVVLAFAALMPPVWLGWFDHVAVAEVPSIEGSSDDVTWRSAMGAAAFTWGIFAIGAPVRLWTAGGIDLSAAGVLAGITASALTHAAAFTVIALLLMSAAAIAGFTKRPPSVEYWLLCALWAIVVEETLRRVVFAPISITGPLAVSVSAAAAIAVAVAWSGIARHRGRDLHGTSRSALSAWLTAICGRGSSRAAVAALIVLPIAAYAFVSRVSTFDWEFLVQKLGALACWLVAFAFIHARVEQQLARRGRSEPRRGRSLDRPNVFLAAALVLTAFIVEQAAVPRIPQWVSDPRFNPEFVLDAYAAVDPSFRVARESFETRGSSDASQFYAYLRANSTLEDVAADPADVRFVRPGTRAPSPPPNIFLFIIDSLRRDYVSAYNERVWFTPAIRAFADDSDVFRRAFSRYGGTGLSVPSIWAGSMLLHKQYVTPFRATNALEKLLDANDYRRFITEDHISDELFSDSDETVGLDHQVPEMVHTFCRTMGELEADLKHVPRDGRPLFAMTRPLDLHIGNIASAKVPPGESYPGFYGPYAARVRRIDGCFGEFIDTLKASGLYDTSIIVLTSDHGDSLGEGQRWGHGFTVFPEVMRIPLIVHVPKSLSTEMATDLGRLAFSVDITPSLYALIGEQPERLAVHADVMGSPLFVPRTAGYDTLSDRRAAEYLVASSYGAVYGLLSHHGRRLYIADGIEGREYAFDLGADGRDRRTGISDAERGHSRRVIQDQIADIARWYRFTPR